jgi:hypothetical protein
MPRKNCRNLEVLAGSAYLFRKGGFRRTHPRPKETLIPYVKPNIELCKPFTSKDEVVASEVKDEHRDILVSMSIDFKVESEDLGDRLSWFPIVSFHSAWVR